MRSVTTREPLFTEQDRGELLALVEYRRTICSACGFPLSMCTSHEATGPQFEATFKVCRVTLARLEQQRMLSENGKKPVPNHPAYLWATKVR